MVFLRDCLRIDQVIIGHLKQNPLLGKPINKVELKGHEVVCA